MPTYSYACTECVHRFDTVQAFSDSSLTECPQCAGRLRKLFGSVGVVFKGSGFYRNDSRASAQDGKQSNAKTEKSDSSSTSSGSSEPTPSASGSESTNGSANGTKSGSSSGPTSGSSTSSASS